MISLKYGQEEMSKRKPVLRIEGRALSRRTGVDQTNVSEEDNVTERYGDEETIDSHNSPLHETHLDTAVAKFLKELDSEGGIQQANKEATQPSKVLFGEWQECIDEKTQRSYYWNVATDEVTWILPQEVSPQLTNYQVPAMLESKPEERKHPVADECKAASETKFQPEESLVSEHKETDTNTVSPDSKHTQDNDCVVNNSTTTEKEKTHLLEESHKGQNNEQDAKSNDKKRSSETALETEVAELATVIFEKLEFLGILKAAFTNFHTILIETETRITDWRNGSLSGNYLLEKLQAATEQLRAYEISATPSGWSCHWDRNAKRYFYKNNTTHKMQWHYPDSKTEEAVTTVAEREGNAEKNTKNGRSPKRLRRGSPTFIHYRDENVPRGSTFAYQHKPAAHEEAQPPLPGSPQKPPLPPDAEITSGNTLVEEPADGMMMDISDDEAPEDQKNTSALTSSGVHFESKFVHKAPAESSLSTHYGKIHKTISSMPTSAYVSVEKQSMPLKPKKSKKSAKKSTLKKPLKAITPLVVQWQRAKDEIQLEERILEESDEEISSEAVSRQQIEKWKQDQISSGKALSNANFEPVPKDWRSRLLKKKVKQ